MERLNFYSGEIAGANATGAFLALAALGSIAFCSLKKPWGFWIALSSCSFFLFLMLQTQSRGALIAFTLGVIPVIIWGGIQLSKLRITALAFIALALSIYGYEIGFSERISELGSDSSADIAVREHIYISGIKMIMDAPNGLPEWLSPQQAYAQYYQSDLIPTNFLSLINSHLQILSASGLFGRFWYIFLWVSAFFIIFSRKKNTFLYVSLGILICLFVSAIFSHILRYWSVWAISFPFLVAAMWINRMRFRKLNYGVCVFSVTLFLLVTLCVLSSIIPRDYHLQFSKDKIVIGTGKKSILIPYPDEKILGFLYPKYLASFCKKNYAFAIICMDKIPKGSHDALIVSSQESFKMLKKINYNSVLFLNTDIPEDLKCENYEIKKPYNISLGEFSDWRIKSKWQKLSAECALPLKIISGSADYIPNWLQYLPKENDGDD